MRVMKLDDQITAAVVGEVVGRAEAGGRAAFLSRAGPAQDGGQRYHVTYLEYPEEGDGPRVNVRYEAGHPDEAAARFDFAAFFYPIMNLARTMGGDGPLGPEELIEAKVVSHEQARLIERLARYGVKVDESVDPDDTSFWQTAEDTIRDQAAREIPDPELRDLLESLRKLKDPSS